MSVCLDQMGPESAKTFQGRQIVRALPDAKGTKPAERAKREIDYGRRGKGYIFEAFQPASGEAFTLPYEGRTTANYVDSLERADEWIPTEVERIYAIVDNLNIHRASDVLLFSLGHPRWEFVFQPRYAAYLNSIEPWWEILRSLALKGRRFEAWEEVCQAVEDATAYCECSQASFRLGSAAAPPTASTLGHWPNAKGGLDLPEEPLSATSGRSASI